MKACGTHGDLNPADLGQAAGLSYNAKSGKVVWALGGAAKAAKAAKSRQSSYAFTPELPSAPGSSCSSINLSLICRFISINH